MSLCILYKIYKNNEPINRIEKNQKVTEYNLILETYSSGHEHKSGKRGQDTIHKCCRPYSV